MAKERGDGGIYRRGSVYWIRYWSRGREYRESAGSTKEADAKRLLRRRLAEVRLGRHTPDAERVRLADLERLLVDDYALNGRRSLVRARRSWRHLLAHFGAETRAVDITPDRIVVYVNARRAEGAAPATIQNDLAALKRGFSLAVRAGRLHHKPAFPTITLNNARQGFFEEVDFRALLAELPEPLRAPIAFAYYTGWRLASEILPLTWARVSMEAGAVRLEPGTTKNREGREFPIDALPELRRLLERQLAYTRAVELERGAIVPHVFHRNGKPIRSVRTAWKNACKRAGLVGRIPHDFRRTAVRNLERAGVPRSVAMKLVGHKTQAIYQRYAIVSQADLAEGVAKLARLHDSDLAGERTVLPIARRSGMDA